VVSPALRPSLSLLSNDKVSASFRVSSCFWAAVFLVGGFHGRAGGGVPGLVQFYRYSVQAFVCFHGQHFLRIRIA